MVQAERNEECGRPGEAGAVAEVHLVAADERLVGRLKAVGPPRVARVKTGVVGQGQAEIMVVRRRHRLPKTAPPDAPLGVASGGAARPQEVDGQVGLLTGPLTAPPPPDLGPHAVDKAVVVARRPTPRVVVVLRQDAPRPPRDAPVQVVRQRDVRVATGAPPVVGRRLIRGAPRPAPARAAALSA